MLGEDSFEQRVVFYARQTPGRKPCAPSKACVVVETNLEVTAAAVTAGGAISPGGMGIGIGIVMIDPRCGSNLRVLPHNAHALRLQGANLRVKLWGQRSTARAVTSRATIRLELSPLVPSVVAEPR